MLSVKMTIVKNIKTKKIFLINRNLQTDIVVGLNGHDVLKR